MHWRFLIALVVVVGGRASAQAAPSSDAPQCLGFSFGRWTPALDWKGAGHGEMPDSSRVPQAPGGRGWAVDGLGGGTDSTFVLFPSWWPVGVVISFDRKPTIAGDTVAGRAYAMVADGTRSPPRSVIRAWLKPCGAGG
jgi:hypothetical protein